MYRREILISELPFKELPFGEDLDWAYSAYQKGYSLVFDSRVAINHYHSYNSKQLISRLLLDFQLNFNYFNFIPSTKFPIKNVLLVLIRCTKRNLFIKWWKYNIIICLATWKASRLFKKSIKNRL
jgi:GT2 family glycosyltransferase